MELKQSRFEARCLHNHMSYTTYEAISNMEDQYSSMPYRAI